MQLNITGHHVDVSPAVRRHVSSKLARIERHFDHVIDVHCILTTERLTYRAEATVHLEGGTIHADSVAEGMYAAIDGLVDKLDRQVKKHKEKQIDRLGKRAARRRYG